MCEKAESKIATMKDLEAIGLETREIRLTTGHPIHDKAILSFVTHPHNKKFVFWLPSLASFDI